MGKHESQGSAKPAPPDATVAGAEAAATSGETLTAPTSPTAPSVASTKKPNPYYAPHEGGKA
jgi:hypothetical protein